MSSSILPMFSSKSFTVSGLTFRSFLAPLTEEAIFAPLYILASFVKDKVSIGAWVYFWVFYMVPLVCISVFVPVPYYLDGCIFEVKSEISKVDSSAPFFFLKTAFAIGVFCVSI